MNVCGLLEGGGISIEATAGVLAAGLCVDIYWAAHGATNAIDQDATQTVGRDLSEAT